MLEVITKGPVPQHLKHRVVVRIMPDLLEVVMLTTDTKALLRVCYSWILDLSIS